MLAHFLIIQTKDGESVFTTSALFNKLLLPLTVPLKQFICILYIFTVK